MGGRLSFPGGGVYHGTKHAVEALSDALRFEVRGFGIDVVVIEPGLIKTDFGETAVGSIGDADAARSLRGVQRGGSEDHRGRLRGADGRLGGRTGDRRARDREGDLAPPATHPLPGDRLRTASPRAARRPAGPGLGSRGGLELPPPGRAVARTAPELRRAWRFLCGRMRRPQRIATLAVVLLGVVALAVLVARPASSHSPAAPAAASAKPNIVFVLTDDLAWNLVKYMPHVQALQRDGMTFTRYYVTDSLCCPSRSSIFSGRFPHDTGVFTNTSPDGGFAPLPDRRRGAPDVRHRAAGAGYRTAMMGKYLNGYTPAGLVTASRCTCRPAGTSGTWPATATRSSTTT